MQLFAMTGVGWMWQAGGSIICGSAIEPKIKRQDADVVHMMRRLAEKSRSLS
jgi:hypothetical protein